MWSEYLENLHNLHAGNFKKTANNPQSGVITVSPRCGDRRVSDSVTQDRRSVI